MSVRPNSSFLTQARRQARRPPPGGIPPYIWATLGGTTVVIGYVYFAFLDQVPVTERRRWIATSPEWEARMGDEEYRKLIQMHRSDILPAQHRASATVNRVGSRIASAANDFAQKHNVKNYSSKPYTYTVIRSEMANAFVLPGNHVVVFTGLFRFIENEDDLAVIIGHELSHNLARHAGEKISGSILVNILGRLSLLLDPSGVLLAFLLPAATVFRELPHSRTQEIEADRMGLLLAADACHDPRAAKRVFAAMQNGETGGSSPEFLSTHPSHSHRISNFDKWMPEALQSYEADMGNRCRHVRESMRKARLVAAQNAAANNRRTD